MIKTYIEVQNLSTGSNFNPIIVRLKQRTLLVVYNKAKSYFNPIIVRLKPLAGNQAALQLAGFQSYNSSIKTPVFLSGKLYKLLIAVLVNRKKVILNILDYCIVNIIIIFLLTSLH